MIVSVAKLESILQRAIILQDIAGEDIYNSSKYPRRDTQTYSKVKLIVHNGHAWSNNLHFSQSRKVHIYHGYVWQAVRGATQDKPKAVCSLVVKTGNS